MKISMRDVMSIILALMLAVFGMIAVSYQIGTTEALLGIKGAGNTFNLGVLKQPFDLGNALLTGGNLGSTTSLIAELMGWGTEFCYLIFVYEFEHVHKGISSGNKMAAEIFGWGIFLVVALNFYADYRFGPALGSGILGHLAFALLMSFMVAFFPLASAYIIEKVI